ncbi:MAG: efflux RND transporter periplasmic adaptor subunit [Bradymonadaceae bacterium]
MNRTPSILILVLMLGIPGCSKEAPSQAAQRERPLPAVAAYELERRDMSRTIEVSGTLESLQRVQLSSTMSGVLRTLNVEEGDAVTRGQLLAALDLDEPRAELRRAEAELKGIEDRHRRAQTMAERGAIGRAEAEDLARELDVARRTVDLWETRLRLGRLTSPIDGVITRKYIDQGSSVGANDQILEIADLSELVLRVNLSERDVVHLEEGQSIEMYIDAHPDRMINGSIRRIFPSADPTSRRVTVEIALGAEARKIRIKPGFLARARIDVERRVGALAIPTESLLASRGADTFVYRIVDDALERREVETGAERRGWTEILAGLDEGDRVVGTNPTNLREGMSVRIAHWID